MLNDNEKNELTEEYEKVHAKVLYLIEKHKGINQQFMAFLLYLSTENLIKHSKILSIWTIVIGVSTILLFITAVIQLKIAYFSP